MIVQHFEVIDFIKAGRVPSTHTIIITAAESSSLDRLDRSIAKTVFFKPFNADHLAAYVEALEARGSGLV